MDQENDSETIREKLESKIRKALEAIAPEDVAKDPMLTPATNITFGDFQCNAAMTLAKKLKKKPQEVAQEVVQRLEVLDICDPPSVAGPGFINLKFSEPFIQQKLKQKQRDPRLGVPKARNVERVVVDFSSPNIAKEMHVGHLRSTIIGDCICRTLEFRGHDVLRINHVGDWGTQFGMLITYLREAYPSALTTPDALNITDLVAFYKAAKKRFDEDADFKETSRKEVVRLQSGDKETRMAWSLLCEQSRREFQKLYDRLDIKLIERGESFYNAYLHDVVDDLKKAGLLEESDGCQVVMLEGYTNREGKPQPLIVQKSDGGFNYETTDLACVRYRIEQDRGTRLVYVTDVGQAVHFAQVFQVARRAGWIPPNVKLEHIGFGVVQGVDGKKFKTRDGETVRLVDLLDEAIVRAREEMSKRDAEEARNETAEFMDEVARAVGIGAVKYADLSQNRTTAYQFSWDKMLALQGNTAPYMLYSYARVQGIARKGNVDLDALAKQGIDVLLQEASESTLARALIAVEEVIWATEQDLNPNRYCNYIFDLATKFNQFYERCHILNEAEPLRTSRLMLAHLTARTIELVMSLLGIRVLQRM